MRSYNYKLLFAFLTVFFVSAAMTFAQGKSEIVGSWSTASVGPTSYENRTTGASKAGRGSSITYKFNADGTFEYTGYMEVTTYNCTTSLYNRKIGKYVVSGSNVTLKPTKDHWENKNSCAPNSDTAKDKTPVELTYRWQVGTDDADQWAIALDDGKGPAIFQREKE